MPRAQRTYGQRRLQGGGWADPCGVWRVDHAAVADAGGAHGGDRRDPGGDGGGSHERAWFVA